MAAGTAKSRLCDAISVSVLELTDKLTELMAEALEVLTVCLVREPEFSLLLMCRYRRILTLIMPN